MRSRPATLLGGALAALLLLAGCGSAEDPAAEDITSSNAEPTFSTASPKPEETTTTESPVGNGGTETVAVELPGLPIGGNASVESETLQCVDVGWTAPPDLPGWLGIAVTGVAFTPAEDFELSSEPCPGGAPSCLDEDFRLTLDGPRCVVAVTWTGPTLEDERFMSFTAGVLACPAERVPECEAFRDAVATEGSQSIALDPAPSEFDTHGTETEGTETEGTETEGTETEGTETEGTETEGTVPEESTSPTASGEDG